MLWRMAAVGFAAGAIGAAVGLATYQALHDGAIADAGADYLAAQIATMLLLFVGLIALRTLPAFVESMAITLAVGTSASVASHVAGGLASAGLVLEDLGWVALNGVAMAAVFLIGLWFVRDANANLRRSAASSA